MAKDMTKGRITPLLIKFTIPLVLGNIFQLTYNAVDSIVVGRFVGTEALAAVGVATPLMNIAILFISGMCMGASILMSMQFGAKNFETLKRQLSTTLLGGLVFSLFVAAVTIPSAPLLVRLLNTPAAISGITVNYLRIIFLALPFTFLYNFFANDLRALGDAKSPLIFLAASALFNVAGDLFFVVVLHMGVEGAAFATALSELLSALGCIFYIKKKVSLLCLGRRWLVFDKTLFRKTVAYGITSALQQACLQIGKALIQGIADGMGVAVIAAFNVVNRVDDFAYVPEQNIGHAMTTLLAQNKGAGENERIRKGFPAGVRIELVYGVFIGCVCFFGAYGIMGLFVKSTDTEVIREGVSYLRLISLMYMLPAVTNALQGFFRGMGDLKITLLSTFANMVGRLVFAYLFWTQMGIRVFAWANLSGWILMFVFEFPMMLRYMNLYIRKKRA